MSEMANINRARHRFEGWLDGLTPHQWVGSAVVAAVLITVLIVVVVYGVAGADLSS